MTFKAFPFFLILFCLGQFCHAGKLNRFTYFGTSYQFNNYENLDFSPGYTTESLAPLRINSDLKDDGLRAYFGQAFSRYFSIEAGISYFGKARFQVLEESTQGSTVTTTTRFTGEYEVQAGDIKAILTWPLASDIYLKAYTGAYIWNSRLEYLDGDSSSPFISSESNNGVSSVGGLGLGISLGQNMAVLLEVESTKFDEVELQTLSASFQFKL